MEQEASSKPSVTGARSTDRKVERRAAPPSSGGAPRALPMPECYIPADDDTFEKLEVWQEAIELAAKVYERFRECRDFEFRGQIQAASASVSNNIAEGYERDSNQEFIRFLFIAKGSCGEVRSQAYLARRLGLLDVAASQLLVAEAKRLSKRIMRFIQVRREGFK